ncbi:MAG: hypothetical protein AAGD22_03955 [Verrucomicrobiota bacterium]
MENLEPPVIPRQPVGRTFSVAVWILGLVALGQVVAVVWKVIDRAPADAERAREELIVEGDLESRGEEAVVKREVLGGGRGEIGDGGMPGMDLVAVEDVVAVMPTYSGVVGAVSDERGLPPAEMEIRDEQVLELLAAAASLRERSDLPGVFSRLREADAILPRHPRILYEMADCLNEMGQRAKATEYWSEIREMGTEGAGDFWALADLKLEGEAAIEAIPSDAILTISNVLEQRHPEVTNGEKVTLRVAIKAKAGVEVLPSDVAVNVFFYDLVNGKDVARTTADQPQYNWMTFPIDWKDQPEEILDVEYFHPVLSPEEIREIGTRQYHGYVIELNYRDQLQDVVAEPRTLRNQGVDSLNPLMNNPLFPN